MTKKHTHYCKDQLALAAALKAGLNCRMRIAGVGTLHFSHVFRTGMFRGKPWAKTICNVRLSASRGVRGDTPARLDQR